MVRIKGFIPTFAADLICLGLQCTADKEVDADEM